MDDKKSLTLRQNAEKVYFCPYCKIVSVNFADFRPEKKYKQYQYTCFSERCGKTFTQNEYQRQSKNGKHYFTRVGEENVDDVLANTDGYVIGELTEGSKGVELK